MVCTVPRDRARPEQLEHRAMTMTQASGWPFEEAGREGLFAGNVPAKPRVPGRNRAIQDRSRSRVFRLSRLGLAGQAPSTSHRPPSDSVNRRFDGIGVNRSLVRWESVSRHGSNETIMLHVIRKRGGPDSPPRTGEAIAPRAV